MNYYSDAHIQQEYDNYALLNSSVSKELQLIREKSHAYHIVLQSVIDQQPEDIRNLCNSALESIVFDETVQACYEHFKDAYIKGLSKGQELAVRLEDG